MTIGIYKLIFEGTDKVYIGLSKNIEKRHNEHTHSLSVGTGSKKLQEAYNLYGLPVLEVLTECALEELEGLEIAAIEVYDSISNGFNSVSGGSLGNGMVGELHNRSTHSNKEIEDAFNLLCEDNYIKYSVISIRTGVSIDVIKDIKCGKAHTWLSKKYPSKYSIMQKKNYSNPSAKTLGIEYPKIISPDGLIYEVDSINRFARNNSLYASNLCLLLHGKTKQHKGWRIYNGCTC